MVHSDGSVVPFVIPPKQVFVLTDAMLTVSDQVAGDSTLAVLAIGTVSSGSPVALRYETAAAGGTMTATFEFPKGIAVKSTTLVCAEVLNFTHSGSTGMAAVAHGFFAPDK